MRRLITTTIAVLASVMAPSFTYAQAREGITVHGHWAIEIRNPDGTVAARHEFENALTYGGKQKLAWILSRAGQFQEWAVIAGAGFCGNGQEDCVMMQPDGSGLNIPRHSRTLTVTALTSGPAPAMRLAGSYTASAAGTIVRVASMVAVCENPGHEIGLYIDGCNGTSPLGDFSERTLPDSIAVLAGQIVQVTVTFTFE